ncbi:MAG: serine/threonine-protein kinase [Pseudomonadota bacterium]
MSRDEVESPNWESLAPHLDRALDLEGHERDTWLAELDITDPPIAQVVRKMLARHQRLDAEGFLAAAPAGIALDRNRAGRNVGAYRLEVLLGQGGMGEVWLAARTDGRFEGKCAIKFLNATAVSQALADRFRREGSFLARLTHPNIARLLDAGAGEGGQPYLALEYVDGQRIDHYCRDQALDVEQRVRLFIEVIAAVAHAHWHLIIHRDLKPSNVLVTRDGQIKLLDFGIAKLLTPELNDGSDHTRVEDAALTPEYAAPEQLLGEPPSTATDVYQLGMLLYVLLTGAHPTAHAGSRSEKIRAALDSVVPSASEAADASTRGKLRGDLDAILAMALRKIPAERYSTAQSMKEDLQRYLDRAPVSARRGVALYRARKFVGRHRVATIGSIIAVMSLLLALLFALSQAREAAHQRDASRRELARASAVNDFATYLVSAASPGDGKFSATELLAASEALIDKQFPKDQPVKAGILAMVGAQYVLSQRYDKATPVFERAAAIAAPIGDPVLNARVNCPRAALLILTGHDVSEGESLVQKTLAELPTAPEYAPLRAECLTDHAQFGFITGEAGPMIRNAQEAIDLFDASPEASVVSRINAQSALAWGYYLAHENEKADREFATVEKALQVVGRERTLAAADNYNNWALVYFRGDIRLAEPLSRRSLELHRYIEGAEGVSTETTFNHAGILMNLGRFAEASPLYEETIRTAEARQLKAGTAFAMMDYAHLKILAGELPAAKALLDRAQAVAGTMAKGTRTKAILAFHWGLLDEALGQPAAARDHYLDSTHRFEAITERVALNVELICGIARVELKLGHEKESAKAAHDALALATELSEPHAPSYLIGEALLVVGDSQRAAGETGESRQSFERARLNFKDTLGAEHALTQEAARKSIT